MRGRSVLLAVLLAGCVADGAGDEAETDGAVIAPVDDGSVEPMADGARPGQRPPVNPPPGGDGGLPDGTAADGAPPAASCVPDRDGWSAVRPLVESRCGTCHGEVTQFGAPYPLLDYDELLLGVEGERRVDRLVARLQEGTMPPVGQPRPTTAEANAILEWATCGRNDVPPPGNPGGYDSTRLPLASPDEPPPDTEFFDLRAPEYRVPQADDHYMCFTIAAPTDRERFIRRIDAVVDESRVLHHLVLLRAEPGVQAGQQYPCYDLAGALYAWAPGTGALQFPEGGLRMPPGQVFVIQMHYNNRVRIPAEDASGVRIYHADTVGPEYGMVALGPTDISVPPRSAGTAEGHCVMPHDVEVFASWPHMHEIGFGFESTVVHRDGAESDLITLRGWDFETQLFYDTPMRLEAGDRIVTRCEFRNPTNRRVGFGAGTEDEMCFNFLYHTPPLPWSVCDQAPPPDDSVPYEGGECLGDDLRGELLPGFMGRLAEGAPPRLEGGPVPEGTWAIVDGTLYLPTFQTPIGAVDPDGSLLAGRGVVQLDGDRFTADFTVNAQVSIGGRVLGQPLAQSAAGTLLGVDGADLQLQPTCGGGNFDRIRYGWDRDRVLMQVDIRISGFTLSAVLTLRHLD